MKTVVCIFCLLLSTYSWAKDEKPYILPQIDSCASIVDGKVASGEYRSSFTDPATGIAVHWQADSANIHAALESPGSGWLAIGLGSDKMNGADMIICLKNGMDEWLVEEHLGKAFFRHSVVEKPKLISAKAKTKDGKTILEFIFPLKLSNGMEIIPGKQIPFILAYYKDKGKFSKHTKKSSGILVLKRTDPKTE
jgi:hypothetical protein